MDLSFLKNISVEAEHWNFSKEILWDNLNTCYIENEQLPYIFKFLLFVSKRGPFDLRSLITTVIVSALQCFISCHLTIKYDFRDHFSREIAKEPYLGFSCVERARTKISIYRWRQFRCRFVSHYETQISSRRVLGILGVVHKLRNLKIEIFQPPSPRNLWTTPYSLYRKTVIR